jgi:hypothetical protein
MRPVCVDKSATSWSVMVMAAANGWPPILTGASALRQTDLPERQKQA